MNYGIINITFDEFVGITWINCTGISLSFINLYVAENFTHLFLFESTSAIDLSNVAITSKANRVGCSAVLIKDSEANLINSSFVGISGIFGAALAVYRSNVTFSGNSMVGYNQGSVGGAIVSVDSSTIFTGSNTFVNNTVPHHWHTDPDTALCSYMYSKTAEMTSMDYASSLAFGGAISSLCSLLYWPADPEPVSNCSFLKISGNSTFAKTKPT
jgi:hypothetical protein